MIRRELGIFLVVGVTTVLIDFVTYRGLAWGGAPIDAAKAAGFLTGTVFAYVANKAWTFGHAGPASGSLWRFALLYAVTLAANVLINAAVLHALAGSTWAVQWAFLLATGTSATLNFLGMKFFVFQAAVQSS
jgi:putative flippase GtrA